MAQWSIKDRRVFDNFMVKVLAVLGEKHELRITGVAFIEVRMYVN